MTLNNGIRWRAAVHSTPGAYIKSPSDWMLTERRPYGCRRAIADSVPARAAKRLVVAFHRPEPLGPIADIARRDQRPVESLDLSPQLHAQPCGADRARVPCHGGGTLGALPPFGPGFPQRLAALFNRGFAVVRDRHLYRVNQRREGCLHVGGHLDVEDLEALELLVVRLGQQSRRGNADQPHAVLGARFAQTGSFFLAIVDEGIHRAPIVGQLQPEDDVRLPDQRIASAAL